MPKESIMTEKERADRMQDALDVMLIWFHGEPCYRSAGGVPMGMPDSVRRTVKRALRDFPIRFGMEKL